MTYPLVTLVEGHCVSGKQAAHERREFDALWSQQEVKVVRHQDPGEACCIGLHEKSGKALDKRVAILVIEEDIPLLDASDHDMQQNTDGIKSGKSWHAEHININ